MSVQALVDQLTGLRAALVLAGDMYKADQAKIARLQAELQATDEAKLASLGTIGQLKAKLEKTETWLTNVREQRDRLVEAGLRERRRVESLLRQDPDPSERLFMAFRTLGGDEREILTMVAERLVKGKGVYGTYNAETDKRDPIKEATEEVADALVYAAMALKRAEKPKASMPNGPAYVSLDDIERKVPV